MTITEFYAARLDEIEAAARDAYYEGQRWITEEEGVYRYPVFSDPVNPGYADQELVQMADRKRDARHIALHDPARVLRQVEAGRCILAMYADAVAEASSEVVEWMLAVVETEARVFSDHADYREDWA
jgi:hypothetical protein